jgi:hypothetical protein
MPNYANKLFLHASVSALVWKLGDVFGEAFAIAAPRGQTPMTGLPCVIHPWVTTTSMGPCPLCGMGV